MEEGESMFFVSLPVVLLLMTMILQYVYAK
jgi:hypothetical protein